MRTDIAGRSGFPSRLATALLLLALLLPALATAGAAQETEGDKVLRVRMPRWPDTLDPQKLSFVEEIAVSALDYEGLTRLDENLQTVPAAAESWEFNAEGTALTFHLRDGLVYNDGSPLTAERFRYAIERACDPNTAATYAAILFDIAGCEALYTSLYVAGDPAGSRHARRGSSSLSAAYEAAKAALGVRAIDDRTLEVQLTHPAPYFPTVASTAVFYPVKLESVAAGGEAWAQDPAQRIGNGPFRMTTLADDQLIGFRANEHYWAGQPKLDGIEYVYIEDPQVALEAYRAGDLHITQLGPTQIPEVEADAQLSPELLTFPTAFTISLMFDLKQEPFTDQKVREAFAYGFDRETYCAEIRSGDCVPTFSWIPPGVPGYIETDAFAFDPEKARQALADSSYGAAGEPAGDQVLLSERRPCGDPACGVVGRALSGGARRRTHPGAGRQRHVYGNGEGPGDLPADIAPRLGPGLSRSPELAQHFLDMRLDDLRRSGRLLQRGLRRVSPPSGCRAGCGSTDRSL